MADGPKMKVAFVVTERDGKSHWNRIGVGFVNRDGSINVKLEALPVGGEFQLRDYVAREDDAPRGNSQRGGSRPNDRGGRR